MSNLGCSRLAGLPQVIDCLLGNPDIGTASVLKTEPTLQPQSHFRRNSGTPVEHARQGGSRYSKLLRCLRNGQPQGGQNIISQK